MPPITRLILAALPVLLMGVPAEAGAKVRKRVLFLGDSMSMGAFGRTFDAELRNAGHEVYTVVTGGATPYYWLSHYAPISCSIGHWVKTPRSERRVRYIRRVPKVEELISEYNPDVVVVQTGTNLYATLRSKRRTKAGNIVELTSLIEKMCQAVTVNGRRCYWITPPDAHVSRYPRSLQSEMISIMKRVVGRYGIVFDSTRVTRFTDPYPKTDGIHYGPDEARTWARTVARDFQAYMTSGPGMSRRAIPVTPPRAKRVVRRKSRFGAEKNRQLVANASTTRGGKPPSAESAQSPADKPKTKAKAQGTDALPPQRSRSRSGKDEASEVVTVQVELKKKSKIGHLNHVTYTNAFVVYEYDVVRVEKGKYPHSRIRIAHMGVMNRKKTRPAFFEPGNRFSLTLAVMSRYPRLERIQRINDLPVNVDLPLYICKL